MRRSLPGRSTISTEPESTTKNAPLHWPALKSGSPSWKWRRVARDSSDAICSAVSFGKATEFEVSVSDMAVRAPCACAANRVKGTQEQTLHRKGRASPEEASAERDVAPPEWTGDVAPLDAPWFATTLRSLRLHLLRVAPVAFRRRNLFVDAGAGGRV